MYFLVLLQQQTVCFMTMEQLLQYATNGLPDDSFDESIIDIPNIYAIIRAPNLLFYIDMTGVNASNDQVLFVDEDFLEPSDEDILEMYGKQYNTEIKRIIDTHDARWISYQPEGSQNSNPLDIDDRTSSIERI